MECSCGCQFELDTVYGNNYKLYPDARYPNTKNLVAICPECNDADCDEVLQLDICG